MEHRVKGWAIGVGAESRKADIRRKKQVFFALLHALCLFFPFSFLAGCTAERPSLVVHSYPFNPRGKAVLVEHFAFHPEISTNLSKGAAGRFGELVALDIQGFLKSAGFPHSLVISPGEEAKGDFLITGSITRAHGGDAQKRRFLGSTGFGATEVRAVGEILDLETRKSVAAFSLTKQSSYTWLANEAAVRENLREIAREIAAILIRAK